MSKIVFTTSLGRKLLEMINGATLPSSKFSSSLAKLLLEEDLLTTITRGSRKSYKVINPKLCRDYIKQNLTYGLEIERWIEIKSSEESITRAELVNSGTNTKVIATRSFKGFLINCYEQIEATIDGEMFILNPPKGSAIFIENYQEFAIPEDVIVVGIENGENFQRIREQRYLFESMKILFVSRYPQSSDLINWLKSIPNQYLHFGDFDLAGINIFQDEFFSHLGERASMFIPNDIEQRLSVGSNELYDKQYQKYNHRPLKDPRLEEITRLIHLYRKAYEQEGYINPNPTNNTI
ncbi:MAG: DUF7281 domain-containing protein [Bacteroidales bacterium]